MATWAAIWPPFSSLGAATRLLGLGGQGTSDRGHLQRTLADRAILQVAQTESQDQDFLDDQRKCHVNPDLGSFDAVPSVMDVEGDAWFSEDPTEVASSIENHSPRATSN